MVLTNGNRIFKKLTNKLFNSSSKFTKNLDEAVSEVSENEVEEDLEKRALEEKLAKNEIEFKNK